MIYYIGIDPGVKTGVAYWFPESRLLRLQSGGFIEMYAMLTRELANQLGPFKFRIEDARLRKWFPTKKGVPGAEKRLQGVGSVKRDCALWEEVCNIHGWNYEMVHPVKGGTKWSADKFRKVTGYQGRTNEHERDSAMLVYNLP